MTEEDTFRHLTRAPLTTVIAAWIDRSGTIPGDQLEDLTMEYGWTLKEFYAANQKNSTKGKTQRSGS